MQTVARVLVRLALGGLLACSVGTARAEDRPSEDDIFGAPSTDTPPTTEPAPPSSPEQSSDTAADGELERGLSRVDEGALAAQLEQAQKRLEMGGRVFLRSQYNVLDEGRYRDFGLSSPNLLDVYLDSRPNDRLRAYIRTRSVYDAGVREGEIDARTGQTRTRLRNAVDQLWVKGDVGRRLFWTVGKQRIKWGAGRFWNPTDFLNPQVLDPLAVLDERLGVSLIKLHVPLEAEGWNLYGIIDLEGASKLGGVGSAWRLEKTLGSFEVTTSVAAKAGLPLRWGADLSGDLWGMDVRAEGALLYADAANTLRRVTDPGSFDPLRQPVVEDQQGKVVAQGVVGADMSVRYSDQDSVTLGAEYFFNGIGYDSPAFYPYLLLAGASSTATGGQVSATRRVLGASFNPLYLGRHYAAAYANLAQPGSWNDTSFTASLLGNLSDGSFVGRLDWRQTVLTTLSVNAYGTAHWGNDRGELRLGLDIPPNSYLPDGLRIVPPLYEVGVGMLLTI